MHNASLVSISFVTAALEGTLPSAFITALREAKAKPQGTQEAADAVQQASVASRCPVTPLPEQLGKCTLGPEALAAGYLLPDTAFTGVLKVQWAEFSAWETEAVNLARDGKATKDSTISRERARDFLGFLRKHAQLPPSLELYMQGNLIMCALIPLPPPKPLRLRKYAAVL